MTLNESSWQFYHAEWAHTDYCWFTWNFSQNQQDDFWAMYCAGGEL